MKKNPIEELKYALKNDQQINPLVKGYYSMLINKINEQYEQRKKIN